MKQSLSTASRPRSALLFFGLAWLSLVALPYAKAAETTPTTSRDSLFRQSLKRPQDASLAFAYAAACIELHDYEGAIGALERVLFYTPKDAHLKAEIGLLYAQLKSHQMAKQYFDAARADGDLDKATESKIAAIAPAIESGAAGNHGFVFIQTGVRYQTNAAFNADSNLLRLSNQDFTLLHPQDRGADSNAFQTVELGRDFDVGNQRGDAVEVRATAYATQQVRFTDLNVGLYDLSVGPRFALAPDILPGWTLKPYAVGGQVFLAGSRYLASGGAGVVADLPVRPGYIIEPGAEVRHVGFSNVSVFSSLNSGDSATVSLAGTAVFNTVFSASMRAYINRNSAEAAYQTSSNYAEEFAVAARFAAPLPNVATIWSLSPYVKLLQTRFDAPNPFVDSVTTRHDDEYQVGIVLDTPLNAQFSLTTNLQYTKIASDIPNYRLRSFSVLSGPAVKF